MNDRLTHLRKIFAQHDADAFLISSASNIFYLSGFNRFLQDHDGFLLVTKMNVFLITSPLYTEAVKKFTPDLQMLETSPEIWYSQMVKRIVEQEHIKIVGFEEHDLRVAEYFDLQQEKVTLKSIPLRSLRIQKDIDEIVAIKKACALTDETFTHILPFIKEDITELELAEKMETFLKKKNAHIGFPSIVAFGRHAAVPHHMTSSEKLTKNSFVLFDFGIRFDNYLSDMSRTVFFGKPTNQQVKLYETVRKSQEDAIKYIESVILGTNEMRTPESGIDPGQARMTSDIFVKDIDRIARQTIEKEQFIPYPHALGHGIGLEVHEAPTLSKYSPEKLLEHMVFTIEPGIYVPQLGGVRIEDMFVMENQKLTQLTSSPKQLIVI